jgi:hypothetical protein
LDEKGETSQQTGGEVVHPSVTQSDLDTAWIGFGAAIDWIVMRGQPMIMAQYRQLEDKADERLVALLSDMPSEVAEAQVRGAREGEPGPLVPIPSGIWRQTATSDATDSGKVYRLIATDDDDEWEGAILGRHVVGYRRVQVRSNFIRENWPEHTPDITTAAIRPAIARAELRRLIERIVAMTPPVLAPLSHREVLQLAKRCMPSAPRMLVRQIFGQLMPGKKRGPRGPRSMDRQSEILELGRQLIAAQLHN